MGIYVFNRDVLIESLANDLFDFGKHIIPMSINDGILAFIFNGYWEDIGTIRAFYEANLTLQMSCRNIASSSRIRRSTRTRDFCREAINGATLRQAIISDGCIISDAHLERSVIGIRSVIQSGPRFGIAS
jgi:glucose-1-phosphate adenylyltransferase